MSSKRIFKTLRMSPDEMSRVMSEMDRAGATPPADVKRAYRRWRLRGTVAVLSLFNDHGERSNFAVEPRDLSSTGMGMLHGTFLHPGTRCCVGLRRLDGSAASIRAEIVRCSLVKAGVYEVGLIFEDRVDPMSFVASDMEQTFQNERVDLEDLRGTVLHVCESRVEQQMLAHQFKGSHLDLIFARAGCEAESMLDESPGLIIVDHAVEDWGGLFVVARLRELGVVVPILFFSADKWSHVRESALEAGADDVLIKPIDRKLLHQATAEYLEKRIGDEKQGSIHYTVVSAGTVGVDLDLLESFVTDLRECAVEIEECLQRGELDRMRKRTLEVRGRAKDFGFDTVARWADELLSAISMGEDDAIYTSAARLREMCGRCKAVA